MFDSLFRRGRRSNPAKRKVGTPPAGRRQAPDDPNGTPSLRDVAPGGRCRIVRLRARGPIRQRLMDLGLVPSALVTVVRRAPLNDPIEIRLGNDLISLRREEAAEIEVAFEA